jgi:hypothetical protein
MVGYVHVGGMKFMHHKSSVMLKVTYMFLAGPIHIWSHHLQQRLCWGYTGQQLHVSFLPMLQATHCGRESGLLFAQVHSMVEAGVQGGCQRAWWCHMGACC